MSLTNGSKAQDESTAIVRRAGLVRVSDDTRIKQGRCLERVLMKKICADQASLGLIQFGVGREHRFHLSRPRIEDIEQISVPAFEILEHVFQLLGSVFGIEPKNAFDDMIGPGLVSCVEFYGLSRRPEGSHDDPG